MKLLNVKRSIMMKTYRGRQPKDYYIEFFRGNEFAFSVEVIDGDDMAPFEKAEEILAYCRDGITCIVSEMQGYR